MGERDEKMESRERGQIPFHQFIHPLERGERGDRWEKTRARDQSIDLS